MDRQAEMYIRKEYSIIALAESLKRGGDQRKVRFERSLSGMTLDLLPPADRFHGAAIPSVAFARDLEVGSQAGGQAIVGSSILPVAAAARPQTILEKGGATVVTLNTTSGTNLPVFNGDVTSSCWIGENDPAPSFTGLAVKSVMSTPKCASSRISYSLRLMAQAENRSAFESSLLAELQAAIKTQLGVAYFSGSGSSSQPLGLLNTPGVQTKTYASTIPTYRELVDQLEILADADGDLSQARFFMHPSTLCALLKQVIDADGGETTAQPQGDGYRIAGIRVHTSTSVTENKIVLADVPTIHIVRYGPAMLLVDPFSAGRSTTGETQIVIKNYVDTLIADRSLVVVGSA